MKVKTITLINLDRGYNKEYQARYNRYRVLLNGITPIESVYSKDQLKSLSYWSNRSNVMAMTCWGTSQLFEAQLALASFLGWNKDNLNKKEDWGEYTSRITKLITAI